jgi:hypothetical protein
MTYTADAFFRNDDGSRGYRVTSREDVDRLIDDMLADPSNPVLAMVYLRDRPEMAKGGPDHQIAVGVNKDAKFGSILLTVDGETWRTQGETDQDEVFYNYYGNDEDFPTDSTIGLDTLRMAVHEILVSGVTKAESVEWAEYVRSEDQR